MTPQSLVPRPQEPPDCDISTPFEFLHRFFEGCNGVGLATVKIHASKFTPALKPTKVRDVAPCCHLEIPLCFESQQKNKVELIRMRG